MVLGATEEGWWRMMFNQSESFHTPANETTLLGWEGNQWHWQSPPALTGLLEEVALFPPHPPAGKTHS